MEGSDAERKRLAGRIGAVDPAIAIDVADELGLLDETVDGYAPSITFPAWRDEPQAVRWSHVARAWWGLTISPTRRITEDGEVSPPDPHHPADRARLRAAITTWFGGPHG